MSKVIYVSDAEFESVIIQAKQPVLLDFWAPWCQPCLAIAPTLDELSDEFDGKAIIAKMNIDENQETPAKFGVRSIPTLLLIKNGEVVKTFIGNQTPKVEYINAINEQL